MNEDLRDSLTQAVPAPLTPPSGADGPRLVALSGPRQGMVFPLTLTETTIGRKPFNTIVLPSCGVSKTHCAVVRENGCFTMVDHESTNGTFVNGRPLASGGRLALTHGDTLTIFDTTFLFLHPPGAAAAHEPVAPRVDFQAAAQEADALLRQSAEAVQLRRARSAGAKAGGQPGVG